MNKPMILLFLVMSATSTHGLTETQALFYNGPFHSETIFKRIKNKDSVSYSAIATIYWRNSFKDPIETIKYTATKLLKPTPESTSATCNESTYQASSGAILEYPDCPIPTLHLEPLSTPQEAHNQFERLKTYFTMYQFSFLVQEKLNALSEAERKAFESTAIIKISAYAKDGKRNESIDIGTKEEDN